MKRKMNRSPILIQCAKCGQTERKIRYGELRLIDPESDRWALVTLCPACRQMFWLLYDGFKQTRPVRTPTYTVPPPGFRVALPYHIERHVEAIQELKREIDWHEEAIRHMREMPK